MLPVDEQLKVITSGTTQIVPMDELKKKLQKGEPLNIKMGVDPTSPDLHLGHAVPLRKLRQFQGLGHHPVRTGGQIGPAIGTLKKRISGDKDLVFRKIKAAAAP